MKILGLITLVCLPLAAQLFTAQPPQPGEAVVVFRGVVVDFEGGRPLEGAVVELRTAINFTTSVSSQKLRAFSAKSNAKGEFAIDAIPGDYTIYPSLPGYDRLNPIVDQVKLIEGSTPPRATVKMVRGATVSGMVEDDDGKPLAKISVELVSTVSAARAVTLRMTTGPDGKFSLTPVAPGTYFLRGLVEESGFRIRTSSPPFAQTYYPNVTDPLGAVQLSIYSGVDLPGLRLRMRKGVYFTVSGKVVGHENNTTPATWVELRRVVDPRVTLPSLREAAMQGRIAADGTFQIEHIPPGPYMAVVMPAVNLGKILFPLGTTPVTVTDRDEDNIQLVIASGGVFAGKLVFEDGAFHPGNWQVTFRGVGVAGEVGTPVKLSADGAFSLDGIPSGRYQFSFGGPTRPAVSTVEIGGRKFEGSKFDFVVPGGSDVVITASRTGGTVQGTLEGLRDPDEKVVGIASLALMSGFTDGLPITRTTPLGADGAFSFTGLEPGRYLVCAWTDQAAEVSALLQSASAPRQRLEQACSAVTMKVDGTEQARVKQTSIADVTR